VNAVRSREVERNIQPSPVSWSAQQVIQWFSLPLAPTQLTSRALPGSARRYALLDDTQYVRRLHHGVEECKNGLLRESTGMDSVTSGDMQTDGTSSTYGRGPTTGCLRFWFTMHARQQCVQPQISRPVVRSQRRLDSKQLQVLETTGDTWFTVHLPCLRSGCTENNSTMQCSAPFGLADL
jgi:hypothetical protein